jgi:hypothetical protein
MHIFEIGQRVRHKTRDVKGSVLEVDGQTIYLEASNGVEIHFAAGELEPDAPAAERQGTAPPDPKHQQLLALMPASVVGLAAVRFARDPATRRNGWADLPALDKLQWVVRVTGLSIEQLGGLARAGKARQIEAHAAVASSRGSRR